MQSWHDTFQQPKFENKKNENQSFFFTRTHVFAVVVHRYLPFVLTGKRVGGDFKEEDGNESKGWVVGGEKGEGEGRLSDGCGWRLGVIVGLFLAASRTITEAN